MPTVKVGSATIKFPDEMAPEEIAEVVRNAMQDFRGDLQTAKDHLKRLADGSVIVSTLRGMKPRDQAALATSMIPGVGDAIGFNADVQDLRENWDSRGALDNAAAVARTGLGALPIVPSMAIFAGVKSAKADLKGLEKAKAMQGDGVDRTRIWEDTGWFEDVDGNWKFEIDDSQAKYDTSKMGVREDYGQRYKLGFASEGLDHPELYQAYPDTAATELVEYPWSNPDGQRGSYRPGTEMFPEETVTLWDKGANKSTMLHEMQHSIQEREGFALGGSPNSMNPNDLPDSPDYIRWRDNRELASEGLRLKQSPEYLEELAAKNKLFESDYSPKIDALEDEVDKAYAAGADDSVIDGLFEEIKGLFAAFDAETADRFPVMNRVDEIHKATPLEQPPQKIDKMKAYQRLAGEAEARNVQARMNMPAEGRKIIPPWETLDVPEDELIVKK